MMAKEGGGGGVVWGEGEKEVVQQRRGDKAAARGSVSMQERVHAQPMWRCAVRTSSVRGASSSGLRLPHLEVRHSSQHRALIHLRNGLMAREEA
jgi:hypothetical protein